MMLLAAAPEIRKNLKKGKIRLAFQPAEESLQGALAMIKDGVLDGVDIVLLVLTSVPFRTFRSENTVRP